MGLAEREMERESRGCACAGEEVLAMSKTVKACSEHAVVCDNVHLCVADTDVRDKSAPVCMCACRKGARATLIE